MASTRVVHKLTRKVLALSMEDQARICDALLESLEARVPPSARDDGARIMEAFDEVLKDMPPNASLADVFERVEARLDAEQLAC